MAYVVGATFDIPPILFSALEAWQKGASTSHEDAKMRQRFAAVFVDCARGNSLRRDDMLVGLPPLYTSCSS
jgi:hypothetical protein